MPQKLLTPRELRQRVEVYLNDDELHRVGTKAEAAGLSGTGIGCYFDDAVHELLGIADSRLQSLYHFTLGRAVWDLRLSSQPAYPTLRRPGQT